jgi:MFS family permease
VLLDLAPLRKHRDFRFVFVGQLVSAFGSFLTYVALPVQIYALTKSSAIVGLLGTVQLVPLAITALWGGALAVNSMSTHASVPLLFIVAAFMSAVNGFHTPSLESLTPKLVDREDLPAVSALSGTRGGVHRNSRSALYLRRRRCELWDFSARAVRDPLDAPSRCS